MVDRTSVNRQWMFERNGFLIVRDAIDWELVTQLRSLVARVHEKRTSAGESIRKLYGFYDEAPDLVGQLLRAPKLLSELRNLLGPNVVFIKNRHNQAALNTSNQTAIESRMHRDILYPTRGLLTAAVYLDPSSEENGATNVIPGSHRLPLVGVTQIDPPGGGTWMDEHPIYDGLIDQALAVPMKPGDVLLFDGLLFHTVGPNRTDTARTSLILGFRSADELDAAPDDTRQILVSGDFLYRGNDD